MLTAAQEIRECRDFIEHLERDIQFIEHKDGCFAIFVHGHITLDDFATALFRNEKCRELINKTGLFPNYHPRVKGTIIENSEYIYLRYIDDKNSGLYPTHNNHAIGSGNKTDRDAFAVTCLNLWRSS